ncbi:helix-turn-helix domain-containing protein [Brachyspira hampsonii]|nr:helix-turn-helix domain-containing protein [Brachyspira hampsonii]MBW5410570.1 helix-turn-helix domain-containing protein [Brachyspira hampsonii]
MCKEVDMCKEIDIGIKIKDIRTKKGILLKDLAKKCGISSSMLSQIEKGNANPSLNTIKSIAKELGVPIFQFFIEEDEKISKINILKEKDRKVMATREVTYELLSPEGSSNIEFIRMILNEKGLESSIEPMPHKGEEVAFLLSGKAEITISDQSAIMYPGDSIYIPALAPHKWKNLYDEESVIIFAVTPPEF